MTPLCASRSGSSSARTSSRRSEEHTSELQSPCNLVCRLLLEKKKQERVRCPMKTCTPAADPPHILPTFAQVARALDRLRSDDAAALRRQHPTTSTTYNTRSHL